jgi:hypothetical protein
VNAAELEALLTGLLRLWQVEASVRPDRDGKQEGISALIEGQGAMTLTVTWMEAPFGIVWQVLPAGRRPRTYPSINGLIRDLRERLVPERGSARVLFVKEVG